MKEIIKKYKGYVIREIPEKMILAMPNNVECFYGDTFNEVKGHIDEENNCYPKRVIQSFIESLDGQTLYAYDDLLAELENYQQNSEREE